MRKKERQIIKLALAIAFAILAPLAFWLPEPDAVTRPSKTMPGKIMLDDPGSKMTEFAGGKGKVPFDHDQHVAKDSCVTCHHTNTKKLTKAVEEEVRKCSECHKAEDSTNELEGTNEENMFKGKTAVSSQDAFHGYGNIAGCIGCHSDRSQKPTVCNECHSGGQP